MICPLTRSAALLRAVTDVLKLMALLFVAAAAASATLASSAAAKQPNILFLLTVRTPTLK